MYKVNFTDDISQKEYNTKKKISKSMTNHINTCGTRIFIFKRRIKKMKKKMRTISFIFQLKSENRKNKKKTYISYNTIF